MLDRLFHKTDHQSETAGLTGKLYGALDNNRCDIRIWINQYKKTTIKYTELVHGGVNQGAAKT